MKPLYVAYFTLNTPYEEEARALKETLDFFHLENRILGVENQRNWQKNTHHKAIFIQQMQKENPDRNLVYLDADARVMKYPSIFDTLNCDFAGHFFDSIALNRLELLGSTLFFGSTDNAKLLVSKWIERNLAFPLSWDQKNLQDVILRIPGLKIEELPSTYVQIFDLMFYEGEPVISQTQASRRLKKVIDQDKNE